MVLELDTAKREFQIAQEVARRDGDRLKIIEVSYRFGEGSCETYLAQLSGIIVTFRINKLSQIRFLPSPFV